MPEQDLRQVVAQSALRTAVEPVQEEGEKSAAICNEGTEPWSEGDRKGSESPRDRNRRRNSA